MDIPDWMVPEEGSMWTAPSGQIYTIHRVTETQVLYRIEGVLQSMSRRRWLDMVTLKVLTPFTIN